MITTITMYLWNKQYDTTQKREIDILTYGVLAIFFSGVAFLTDIAIIKLLFSLS